MYEIAGVPCHRADAGVGGVIFVQGRRGWVTIVAVCAALTALTASCAVPGRGGEAPPAKLNDQVSKETDAETGNPLPEVVQDGDHGIAYATSQKFFGRAPFIVVAPEENPDAVVRAASLAVATSVPLLVSGPADGDAIAEEADRLGTSILLAFGAAPAVDDLEVFSVNGTAEELSALTGLSFVQQEVTDVGAAAAALAAVEQGEDPVLYSLPSEVVPPAPVLSETQLAESEETGLAEPREDFTLPSFGRGDQDTGAVVLASPEGVRDTAAQINHVAATAVARSAGAEVVLLPVPDPRATGESVAAMRKHQDATLLALGSHFGTSAEIRERIDAALNVTELPGGGQLVYPGRRMIALYGHPGVPAMGVLGEQGPRDAIARARDLAQLYEEYSGEPVIPALEVIVTVASVAPGADNMYSNASQVEDIRPWIEAARDEGTYIVLDLQPGRNDFLTQAKIYEDLLKEPHVGLALDPEWRLRPDQVHLQQVGQVDAREINEVIEWLADLTSEHNLPQKLLVLHQFQTRMITNRDQLDTTRDEVSLLIHADGHGVPAQKMDTWNVLKEGLQEEIWLGWKNFYDEDSPTFTPAETMAVEPAPWFVSYQ